jgi:hypothetical protein
MEILLIILRDQIWQFIGALLALLTIGLTVYLFIRGQQVKALQVVVLAITPSTEIEETPSKDMANRTPIGDKTSLIIAKLEHIGNQSIREQDFVRPISFGFPGGTTVVRATVTNSLPENIGMTAKWEGNVVTLSKSLLNAGERIIIEFLVTNLPSNKQPLPFTVDARFAEGKPVAVVSAIQERRSTSSPFQNHVWQWIGVVTGFLALIVALSSLSHNIKKLQVAVLINRPMLQFQQSGIERPELLYRGAIIPNPSEIIVEVANIGRIPILPRDFIQPITFEFQKGLKLYEAQLLNSNPPNIGMSLNGGENTAWLQPVLLNPEDKVTIRFIVSNISPEYLPDSVNVSARIIGLQRVELKFNTQK